jgi:hypothetical protein
MHSSPAKAIFGLFSLLLLLTFTTAIPLPTEDSLNQTSLGHSTRQLSGVFYGDACTYSSSLESLYPNSCYFTVNSEAVGVANSITLYLSSLYIFRMDCTLIGYAPSINLDGEWYSMDSELPYTLDVIAWDNYPQFNYAGQHQDSAVQGDGTWVSWKENDSGITVQVTKFIFGCRQNSKPRSTEPNPTSLGAPVPRELSSVATPRQITGVFTGNLCDPNSSLRNFYPKSCYFAINSEEVTFDSFGFNGQPLPTTWQTSLFIFRMDCTLTGYVPSVDLEGTWYTMDSYLPYTVDVVTYNNVPQFNYAGQHYDAATPGSGLWVSWDENDGLPTHITRFMFDCDVGASRRSIAPDTTSSNALTTRQFGSIFTGDACDVNLATPGMCFFVTSGVQQNIDGDPWAYWTTMFIFREDCELIGYVPGVNLETQWYAMDSQLPYTLDVITYGGVPSFWYAGKLYNTLGGMSSTFWQTWTENDGEEELMCRFLFYC